MFSEASQARSGSLQTKCWVVLVLLSAPLRSWNSRVAMTPSKGGLFALQLNTCPTLLGVCVSTLHVPFYPMRSVAQRWDALEGRESLLVLTMQD